MFNQPSEEILVIPHNFAEIVAKSQESPNPLTAKDVEAVYAQAEEEGVQAFWWAVRFDAEDWEG